MASYANQVEIFWIEDLPSTPQIQAIVLDAWKMPATSNNPEQVVYREMDRVTVPAPSTSRVTLPFSLDIDTWAQATGLLPPVPTDFGHSKWTPPFDRQQCVVVQDGQGGILFRSPWFEKALPNPGPPTGGLPPGAPADPNGFIDVLVPDVQITTAAQLNAELATRVGNGEFNNPPADPSTVVTAATVTLGSGELTLTVTGTRSSGGFTYTLVLTIGPSEVPFLWKDEAGPLRARKVNASVSFVAATGQGFVTFFLNLFSEWAEQAMTPVILEQLNQGLVNNARNQVAQLAFSMPAQLPAEVILSVRRIAITATGISGRGPGVYAWGAIGSFGRLLGGHLPKINTGSDGTCVVMALLARLVLRKDVVEMLRYVRDAMLLKTPAGQRAVALYYEHSHEMIALLAIRPPLARNAAAIVSALVDDLRVGGCVSVQTRDGAMALAHELLPLASPHLRRDIEETLRDGPWDLLQLVS
ncbi:MAG TPA: hypothetical protein VH601_24080 [Bryobacteraceae bacterium]|jgi:hypothetical protein